MGKEIIMNKLIIVWSIFNTYPLHVRFMFILGWILVSMFFFLTLVYLHLVFLGY